MTNTTLADVDDDELYVLPNGSQGDERVVHTERCRYVTSATRPVMIKDRQMMPGDTRVCDACAGNVTIHSGDREIYERALEIGESDE